MMHAPRPPARLVSSLFVGLALAAGACGPAGLPDFTLPDVNATSASFAQDVRSLDQTGGVSVWYFGHADCPYCSAQFGHLDTLQTELAGEGLNVRILGVNAAGHEAANDAITEGRDLPWLQDQPAVDAWAQQGARWRDVFVYGPGAETLVHEQNLTDSDLGESRHYEALAEVLRGAGG